VKKYRLNTKERANGKSAREYGQKRTENETWEDPKCDAKISLKTLVDVWDEIGKLMLG